MTGIKFYDRVKETSTTTGTGTLTLAGAVTGFQSFSVLGNGNSCFYTIEHINGSEWEVGIGTYTSSGTTLSRNTVIASSNSNNAVNLSSGSKFVWVDFPANSATCSHPIPLAVNSTASLDRTHSFITCNNSSSCILSLPSASVPFTIYIKKLSTSANLLTVQRSGSDTIDGATSIDFLFQYEAMKFVSDGSSSWHVVSRSRATHATTHESGGTDPIKLDNLAAPNDNTDLNATTSAHGLLKKLSNVSTEFLNGQGNWVALSASSSITTGTLPIVRGGTGVSAIQSFSGYRNTNLSINTASWMKINVDSERFDIGSVFDSAVNYRFQPTIAGIYQMSAYFSTTDAISGILYAISIWKNGSLSLLGTIEALTAANTYKSFQVTGFVLLNGSTDYAEMYAYNGHGSSTLTLIGGANNNRFEGCWVGPAS